MKKLSKIQALICFIAFGLILALGIVFTFVPMQFGSKDYESFVRALPISQQLNDGVSVIYTVAEGEDVTPDQMKTSVKKISNMISEYGYPNAIVSQIGNNKIRVDIRETLIPKNVSETLEFLKAIPSGKLVLSTSKVAGTVPTEENGVVNINGWEHIESIDTVDYRDNYGITINFTKEGKALYESVLTKSLYIFVDGKAWPNEQYNTINATTSAATTSSLSLWFESNDVIDYYYNTMNAGTLPIKFDSTVETFYVINNNTILYFGIGLLLIFVAIAILVILKQKMFGVFNTLCSLFSLIIIMFILQATTWVEFGVSAIITAVFVILLSFFINSIVYKYVKDEFLIGKSLQTSLQEGFSKSSLLNTDIGVFLTLIGLLLAIAGKSEITAVGTILVVSSIVITLVSIFVQRLLVASYFAYNQNNYKYYSLPNREDEV